MATENDVDARELAAVRAERDRAQRACEQMAAQLALSPSAGDVAKLVEELRAGLDGVTPGPWVLIPMRELEDDDGDTAGWSPASIEGDDGNPVCLFADPSGSGTLFENAANHAHILRCSPDNIAKLLTALESLSRDLAEAREALAESQKFRDYENDTWRKAHAAMCVRANGLDRARLTFETALTAIRRRAIFGPSIAISDLLDLTQSVAGRPADASLCPHAPTYDAGLCCGHPDDCTFVSPSNLAKEENDA